jgi:hypothetical protein
MRETICNCYIDTVTIRKQPGRLVAQVRMTHATLLRSRMNGNVHVRFCSRVGVATSRLRQRGQVDDLCKAKGARGPAPCPAWRSSTGKRRERERLTSSLEGDREKRQP